MWNTFGCCPLTVMKYCVGPLLPIVCSEKYRLRIAVGICVANPAKRRGSVGAFVAGGADRGNFAVGEPTMVPRICGGFGLPTVPVSKPVVRNVPLCPVGSPGMMNSTRPAGGTLRVV